MDHLQLRDEGPPCSIIATLQIMSPAELLEALRGVNAPPESATLRVPMQSVPDAEMLSSVIRNWSGSQRPGPDSFLAYGGPSDYSGKLGEVNNRGIHLQRIAIGQMLEGSPEGYGTLANELTHHYQGYGGRGGSGPTQELFDRIKAQNKALDGWRKYKRRKQGEYDGSPEREREGLAAAIGRIPNAGQPALDQVRYVGNRAEGELQSSLYDRMAINLMAALFAERNQPPGTRPR